jgi:hypothetical protein
MNTTMKTQPRQDAELVQIATSVAQSYARRGQLWWLEEDDLRGVAAMAILEADGDWREGAGRSRKSWRYMVATCAVVEHIAQMGSPVKLPTRHATTWSAREGARAYTRTGLTRASRQDGEAQASRGRAEEEWLASAEPGPDALVEGTYWTAHAAAKLHAEMMVLVGRIAHGECARQVLAQEQTAESAATAAGLPAYKVWNATHTMRKAARAAPGIQRLWAELRG